MAPKGLTPAQVSYREGTLRKATSLPEWKADLEKNYWSDDFASSDQFRKDLEKDYEAMRAVMVELGLAERAVTPAFPQRPPLTRSAPDLVQPLRGPRSPEGGGPN